MKFAEINNSGKVSGMSEQILYLPKLVFEGILVTTENDIYQQQIEPYDEHSMA